jgi:hypothetical protein
MGTSTNTQEFTSNLQSADEYREMVANCARSAAESWERSDNDGFLSQHANAEMGNRYHYAQTVAENGGKVEDLTLFLNGKIASHKQLSGQWGIYWVLNDEAAASHGKRFFTGSKARDSVKRDRAKGFTYGAVEVVALISRSSGHVFPHPEAIAAGQFVTVKTDGAYDHIEASEAAQLAS